MNIKIIFSTVTDYEDAQLGDDELEVTSDIRHWEDGYRVSRWVFEPTTLRNEKGQWNWDEQYQFYTSLDEVKRAYESKDYEAGRKAF